MIAKFSKVLVAVSAVAVLSGAARADQFIGRHVTDIGGGVSSHEMAIDGTGHCYGYAFDSSFNLYIVSTDTSGTTWANTYPGDTGAGGAGYYFFPFAGNTHGVYMVNDYDGNFNGLEGFFMNGTSGPVAEVSNPNTYGGNWTWVQGINNDTVDGNNITSWAASTTDSSNYYFSATFYNSLTSTYAQPNPSSFTIGGAYAGNGNDLSTTASGNFVGVGTEYDNQPFGGEGFAYVSATGNTEPTGVNDASYGFSNLSSVSNNGNWAAGYTYISYSYGPYTILTLKAYSFNPLAGSPTNTAMNLSCADSYGDQGMGVNDAGLVVGGGYQDAGPAELFIPAAWNAASGAFENLNQVSYWPDGTPIATATDNPTELGDVPYYATGINNSGQVVTTAINLSNRIVEWYQGIRLDGVGPHTISLKKSGSNVTVSGGMNMAPVANMGVTISSGGGNFSPATATVKKGKTTYKAKVVDGAAHDTITASASGLAVSKSY